MKVHCFIILSLLCNNVFSQEKLNLDKKITLREFVYSTRIQADGQSASSNLHYDLLFKVGEQEEKKVGKRLKYIEPLLVKSKEAKPSFDLAKHYYKKSHTNQVYTGLSYIPIGVGLLASLAGGVLTYDEGSGDLTYLPILIGGVVTLGGGFTWYGVAQKRQMKFYELEKAKLFESVEAYNTALELKK